MQQQNKHVTVTLQRVTFLYLITNFISSEITVMIDEKVILSDILSLTTHQPAR